MIYTRESIYKEARSLHKIENHSITDVLHILHWKGISLTTHKDPIDDLCSVRKEKQQKLSFPSLLIGTIKKLKLTFVHSRLLQIIFYHLKSAHYPQDFHLDLSKCQEIQI